MGPALPVGTPVWPSEVWLRSRKRRPLTSRKIVAWVARQISRKDSAAGSPLARTELIASASAKRISSITKPGGAGLPPIGRVAASPDDKRYWGPNSVPKNGVPAAVEMMPISGKVVATRKAVSV